MKCSECGRELREDSKFCDYCGHIVAQQEDQKEVSKFNISALFGGILFSILITLIVSGSAAALGIPLLFGGLFLPFFWIKRKK